MLIKQNLVRKYRDLSENKPLGVDLTNIDHNELFHEVQNNRKLKSRLNRFGQIFIELEGYKQFNSVYLRDNSNSMQHFKNAIIYNELIQVQVFYEFIKSIKVDSNVYPNLFKIKENEDRLELRNLRNSIAHFDWTCNDGKILFKDREKVIKQKDYVTISEFCSLISIVATFMTKNINDL